MTATELPIPLIDLRGEPGAVARAIGRACREVGFFAITGHGVDPAVVDAAWDSGRTFFGAPLAERMRVAMPEPGYPYGYAPFAGEVLARSLGDATPPDLKETFSIGPLAAPPDRPDHGYADPDQAAVYAPNRWPDVPASFRPAWEAYYRAMADLATRLMRLFARALELPTGYFDPFVDRHGSALRMVHYPDLRSGTAVPGQLRAGPHTDYGTLTILRQDAAPGGLEVRAADDRWAPVPYADDTFVINLGDLMARWTNDRWRSTLHRVVLPPADAEGSTERFSMPFFHNANWDARIECLPTCLDPGEAPRYAPVSAGAHLMSKFRATVVDATRTE